MKKEVILLYNINEKEKEYINKIFENLNIDIEFQKAEIEEDIIAYPSFMAFIKMPKEKEKVELINQCIEGLRGWEIFFFIDNNFIDDTQKIEQIIKDYYEDYTNLKVYYDFNNVKDGIIGFAVGDALGVPVESRSREELKRYPITDMIGNGTYNVPKGTWSDDTSMTLATMDSIIQTNKIDTNDIANKFLDWYRNNNYTATGKVFDIGRTTFQALAKFELKLDEAEKCGQVGEMDNGNGSLMRMLPIAYYIALRNYQDNKIDDKEIYNIVKKVSSITHGHETSVLGCYIFVRFALEIIDGKYKDLAYEHVRNLDYSFFDIKTVEKYNRILKENIKYQNINNIKSTGYIVDTLEAVFWLFLNSKDYDNTILKAVNLGNDTDTIAAITGGLLGIHYGIESINENWKKSLKKFDYIERLCDEFYKVIEVN